MRDQGHSRRRQGRRGQQRTEKRGQESRAEDESDERERMELTFHCIPFLQDHKLILSLLHKQHLDMFLPHLDPLPT
jgi:hypothetical protein